MLNVEYMESSHLVSLPSYLYDYTENFPLCLNRLIFIFVVYVVWYLCSMIKILVVILSWEEIGFNKANGYSHGTGSTITTDVFFWKA